MGDGCGRPDRASQRDPDVRMISVQEILERLVSIESLSGDEAEAAYTSWGWGVLLAIDELASPFQWRFTALVVTGNPIAYLEDEEKRAREEKRTKKKRKRAMLDNEATVAWLHQVLEPWFRGKAHLNAHVLHNLLSVVFRNPIRMGSAIRDADMIRGLEEYKKAREKHTPREPEWLTL